MSRSHYGHDLGSELGGGAVLLGIVLLALAVYLTVKAVNLVCRVMANHTSHKLPWVLLGCVVFFGLIALVTKGEPIATGLAIASLLLLLFVCRILDLYYADSLQKQGTLIENVLRRKWWEPVSPNAALAATGT